MSLEKDREEGREFERQQTRRQFLNFLIVVVVALCLMTAAFEAMRFWPGL